MKQFRNTRTRLVPSGRRLLTMALSLPLRPAHARASRFVAEVLFEDRLLSVDAPPPSSRVLALRDTISAMGTRAYRVYPSGPAAEPEDARILYNGDFELTSSPGVRTRSRNKQRNTQTKNTPAGGTTRKGWAPRCRATLPASTVFKLVLRGSGTCSTISNRALNIALNRGKVRGLSKATARTIVNSVQRCAKPPQRCALHM